MKHRLSRLFTFYEAPEGVGGMRDGPLFLSRDAEWPIIFWRDAGWPIPAGCGVGRFSWRDDGFLTGDVVPYW